jgi:hypothetical protein
MVWFGEDKRRDRLDEYLEKMLDLLLVVSGERKEGEREEAGYRGGGLVGLLAGYLVENLFSFVILRGKEVVWFPAGRVKGVVDLVEGEAFMFGGAFREFCRGKGYRVGIAKRILQERKILIPYFVGERLEFRTVRRFRVLGGKGFSGYRLDLRMLSFDGRSLVEVIEERLKRGGEKGWKK